MSEPPLGTERDDAETDRRKLERVIPELIRRALEVGLEKLAEGPENVRRAVGDLRLPREALTAILSQLDETKTGLYRVVAKEVRDILEQTNFADELVRALTAVSFEIRTSVRFVPNESGSRATPEVKSKLSVQRNSSPPPAPEDKTPGPPDIAPASAPAEPHPQEEKP